MSDEQKYAIFGLNEYIRQGEPQKRERSEAWKVAIEFQQVDGLQTSEYLLDTAKRHIEGDIRNAWYFRNARTVKSITMALQEKNMLRRVNGRRPGWKGGRDVRKNKTVRPLV